MNQTSFKNKKFAVVANTAWNIGNFRLPVIQKLMELGGEVHVFAPNDDTVEQFTSIGASFTPLKNLGRKGKNPFQDYMLIRELARLYREKKIDVALHYTIKPVIYGCLAGNKANTSTISTITGLGYMFMTGSLLQMIATRLYKRALRKADIVVFQNEDDRQLFHEQGLVEQSRVRLVRGSGVDTEHFSRTKSTEGRGDNKLRFLFVGRLLRDKGINELLEASRHLEVSHPNIEFHIVGDHDPHPTSLTVEEIETWKKQKNLTFYGYSPDVKKHLEDCDVFLLPSYREGLPRVVLEAMSMSMPCVTTRAPGCKDTVEEGKTGFLVEVGDSESLRNAVIQMSELTREQRQEMGNLGRSRCLEIFAQEIVVDAYIGLIQEVLQTKLQNQTN